MLSGASGDTTRALLSAAAAQPKISGTFQSIDTHTMQMMLPVAVASGPSPIGSGSDRRCVGCEPGFSMTTRYR